MKIRTGFVSNSSSSSFCFIGIQTTLFKIDPKSFSKGKTYFAEMDGSQFYGEGGRVIAWIMSEDVLDFMKEYGHVDTVYEVLKSSEDGEMEISGLVIPKNKKVVLGTFEIDQHTPSDLEGVKELYEYADLYHEDVITFIRLEHTTDGHYKFYEMKKLDDDTWEAGYGRIGSEPTRRKYEMSRWNEKLTEKLKEGYEKVD